MIIYTPYTYLIGWSNHQKYYYGVRYAKDCHPDDLWDTYFTSSKIVREFRELNGEPDIIQVRKRFNDPQSALEWECNVLQKMNVTSSDNWLNQGIPKGSAYACLYKTEEHKRNISIANSKPKTGRALEACIENYKKAAEINRGKKRPEHSEYMKKRSKEMIDRGEWISKSGKDHPCYGKKHSIETIQKIKHKAKNRMKVVCCIKCHKPKNNDIHDGMWMCHYKNHHKDCK